MSDVIWNLTGNGQYQAYGDLFDALGTGVILGGSPNSFSMTDGPAVVIFHGSFTLVNGTITAGTISNFEVYHSNASNKLLDVTGYAINFQAFKMAVTAASQNDPLLLYHLLLNPPLIVNGTNLSAFELLVGGFRGDQISGKGGPDFIQDLGGSDVIYGGKGDDAIDDDTGEALGGIAGDDFLFGGDGDDVISGGGGNDVHLGRQWSRRAQRRRRLRYG